MARVLIPIPISDFDPTEVAVSWQVLDRLGHDVSFSTPTGRRGRADPIMLTGRGLDWWGFIPGLRRLGLVGRLLGANADARSAYDALEACSAFQKPLTWDDADAASFDGLLLPGGHARGMRDYLESEILQRLVGSFFAAEKPVGAICHGVLLAARSRRPGGGRSVLHGRRTTALTWSFERKASLLGRIFRFWDPSYYRTYDDGPGRAAGYMSVQQEVTRALAGPSDFLDVPADDPLYRRKTSGTTRDTWDDGSAVFVVCDRNYVSARWPGDAHRFAREFADVLTAATTNAAASKAPVDGATG